MPYPGFSLHLHKHASWTESCNEGDLEKKLQTVKDPCRVRLAVFHCKIVCFDLSSLHILAASTLAGDSVLGSASIDITVTWSEFDNFFMTIWTHVLIFQKIPERRIFSMLWTGLHRSLLLSYPSGSAPGGWRMLIHTWKYFQNSHDREYLLQ